jgi:hypothetical protein
MQKVQNAVLIEGEGITLPDPSMTMNVQDDAQKNVEPNDNFKIPPRKESMMDNWFKDEGVKQEGHNNRMRSTSTFSPHPSFLVKVDSPIVAPMLTPAYPEAYSTECENDPHAAKQEENEVTSKRKYTEDIPLSSEMAKKLSSQIQIIELRPTGSGIDQENVTSEEVDNDGFKKPMNVSTSSEAPIKQESMTEDTGVKSMSELQTSPDKSALNNLVSFRLPPQSSSMRKASKDEVLFASSGSMIKTSLFSPLLNSNNTKNIFFGEQLPFSPFISAQPQPCTCIFSPSPSPFPTLPGLCERFALPPPVVKDNAPQEAQSTPIIGSANNSTPSPNKILPFLKSEQEDLPINNATPSLPNLDSIPPNLKEESAAFPLSSTPVDENRKVGAFTIRERREKIRKYLEKRKNRIWKKKISYDCRKRVADKRLRIKGRFVTRDQAFAVLGTTAVDLSKNDLLKKIVETNNNCSIITSANNMKIRNIQALFAGKGRGNQGLANLKVVSEGVNTVLSEQQKEAMKLGPGYELKVEILKENDKEQTVEVKIESILKAKADIAAEAQAQLELQEKKEKKKNIRDELPSAISHNSDAILNSFPYYSAIHTKCASADKLEYIRKLPYICDPFFSFKRVKLEDAPMEHKLYHKDFCAALSK